MSPKKSPHLFSLKTMTPAEKWSKFPTQLILCIVNQTHSYLKRISGEGFLRFSGMGVGSFGRLRNFRVVMVLTSIESVYEINKDFEMLRGLLSISQIITWNANISDEITSTKQYVVIKIWSPIFFQFKVECVPTVKGNKYTYDTLILCKL